MMLNIHEIVGIILLYYGINVLTSVECDKPKLTRQNAIAEIAEFKGKDPLRSPEITGLFSSLGKQNVLDKMNKKFDKYLESGDTGAVKAGSAQVLTVVNAIGSNAALLKSGDGMKVLSGVMGIMSAAVGLVPGGQPIAIVLTVLGMAFGLASNAKSESQKMQDFIDSALWNSRITVTKNGVKTFLRKNGDTLDMLTQMVEDEEAGRGEITLRGIEDAMDQDIAHYGSQEIYDLWTIIENNIDLEDTSMDKTSANGLKVYNMIELYVKAVLLRDITFAQFKVAAEMALERKCSKKGKRSCVELTTSEHNELDSVYRNVIRKMERDREEKYVKVGEYLEHKVLVRRAAVLVHHHPIGWSHSSKFIHDFIVTYANPSADAYQASWVTQSKKKYMIQSVKYPGKHVEPESNVGMNDVLELEDSKCHIEYAADIEKIHDASNNETNGYFVLKQPQYETFGSWDKPGIWRYYRLTRVLWLRLESDIPSEFKKMKIKNAPGSADEYLFIMLTEEKSDEARCTNGCKPKAVFIPKRARNIAKQYLSYSTSLIDGNEKRLATYHIVGDYTPFYLHDCQGSTNCYGCHSVTYKPSTVDGRKCK